MIKSQLLCRLSYRPKRWFSLVGTGFSCCLVPFPPSPCVLATPIGQAGPAYHSGDTALKAQTMRVGPFELNCRSSYCRVTASFVPTASSWVDWVDRRWILRRDFPIARLGSRPPASSRPCDGWFAGPRGRREPITTRRLVPLPFLHYRARQWGRAVRQRPGAAAPGPGDLEATFWQRRARAVPRYGVGAASLPREKAGTLLVVLAPTTMIRPLTARSYQRHIILMQGS